VFAALLELWELSGEVAAALFGLTGLSATTEDVDALTTRRHDAAAAEAARDAGASGGEPAPAHAADAPRKRRPSRAPSNDSAASATSARRRRRETAVAAPKRRPSGGMMREPCEIPPPPASPAPPPLSPPPASPPTPASPPAAEDEESQPQRQGKNNLSDLLYAPLDFLRRLYAPKNLLSRYETLETVVKSAKFRALPPAAREPALAELAALKMRIEARQNKINHLASFGGSLHGAYVGVMASMLCIFVPQLCPPDELHSHAHACSYYENATGLTRFNMAVLVTNVWTLFMVILTEVAILRRENWLDSALSYDPDESANHLIAEEGSPSVLEEHPFIAHQLLWQNQACGNLARASIFVVVINLIMSSVLVLRFYFSGASSVIGLVTNTVLLGGKLVHAWGVCLSKKFQAVSIYKGAREREARDSVRLCHAASVVDASVIDGCMRFNRVAPRPFRCRSHARGVQRGGRELPADGGVQGDRGEGRVPLEGCAG
jgi:hypothetical protein